jgi:hypothetical protein
MKHRAAARCFSAALILGFASSERPSKSPLAPAGLSTGRCEIVILNQPLSPDVRETSGLARSRRADDLFWTHNDSGNEPILFGLNGEGEIVARVGIEGANFRDWEDIEAGRCPGGNCLLLADVGDNDGRRDDVAVYRVTEPATGAKTVAVLDVIRAGYPDRPQDAEAVFQLSSGEIFLVTKGRHGPVALYRLPNPGSGAGPMTKVRDLWPQPSERADWITSATTTPDGRLVILRSYRTLYFFRPQDLLKGEGPSARFDLVGLDHLQGEAIAVSNDGTVWLTSEARGKNGFPGWSRLTCALPPAR